jgi:flagellar biosynthesis repressor protein FlbT
MVLKISARPGELLLINGALIRIEDRRARITFLSTDVPVVPGRLYMREEEATTPLKKAYFALQQHYAGPDGERRSQRGHFNSRVRTLRLDADYALNAALDEVERHVKKGELFKALLALRRYIYPVPKD